MLRLLFCIPKGNTFLRCLTFSLIKKICNWGKTDHKNKYQCFCSPSLIFARLQVFYTFLYIFSHIETTETESKCKGAMLTLSCQTTWDIVLEIAQKPSFTLLSSQYLLYLPGKHQVSLVYVSQGAGEQPVVPSWDAVGWCFGLTVTDAFPCLWDDSMVKNWAFRSLSLLSFLSRYLLWAQMTFTMSMQECFCYSLDC